MKIKLYDIAHSRAGDKGDSSTLSLIPYDEKDYPLLKEKVTAQAVKEHGKEKDRHLCVGLGVVAPDQQFEQDRHK